MGKNIVILLDVNNKKINVYTSNGLEILDLEDYDELADIAGDSSNVMYITNVVKTDVSKVVKIIEKLFVKENNLSEDMSKDIDNLDDEVSFLASISKGPIHIQDIDLTFWGPHDCKRIDDEMKELISQSFQLRQLMKNGTIKVLTSNEMRKTVRKETRKRTKEAKIKQKQKDNALDSILVKDSEPGTAASLADGLFNDSDTIEITEEDLKENSDDISEDDILSGKLS